jgi:hypothetical protein
MLYDEATSSERCSRLTGIPPHVAILNEMATLKEMIATSSSDLKQAFKDELNNRGIGGERFQANEVLEGVKRIHERMERMVASGMVMGMQGGGIQQVNTPNALTPALVVAPEPSVPILVEDAEDSRGRRKMYCWGGEAS